MFDTFRVLRKVFDYKDYSIYIQDIIFWILTGILLLYSTFVFNDGELRLFMILGAFLGFAIYLFTLSKIFIKINVSIILFIKKVIITVIKILLIPIKQIIVIMRKIFLKPVTFFVINMKKTFKDFKLSKNKKIKKKSDLKEGF